jgi:predicted TIM-barrel fold metal-dependent hydrolase
MIIDAHVYCLPERLRSREVKLPSSEKSVIEAIYRHPDGEKALSFSSPETILGSMKRSKINVSLLVSLPWRSMRLCQENNEFILDAARRDKCFMAVCSVQPCNKDWKKEAARCLKKGAVGIKVNPTWQGYVLDCREMASLAGFIARENVFLMTHIDHVFRKSSASPAHLLSLVKKCPETRILAAHLGGMLGIYAMHQPVAAALRNVWFDTAVSSTVKMVEFVIRSGLEDKVIFGSDFPFNHSHKQGQVLEAIKSLNLGKGIEAKIFCSNIVKLIKG